VQGVVSVSIDKRSNEAAVIRKEGTAPGGTLVAAVRRVGYTASVIPTLRFEREVPGMERVGVAERVNRLLRAEVGVRGVVFPSRTQLVVFYDGRRLNEQCLVRTVKRAGIDCPASAK